MKKNNINSIEILEMSLTNVDEIKLMENELNISITSKENIIKDINNSNFKYFIAKYNDIIIGYISICYVMDIDIEAIVVRKDYQNQGIGSLLLKHVFEFAKTNNMNNIFLEVRVSNKKAINLYTKNGFEQIDVRKKYYPDNLEDAIIFKKCIE